MQNYCVVKKNDQILSFLLDEHGHALEIHADGQKEQPSVGDIYIGRVQNVAKNIQAAFVEISPGQTCYLPLEDLKDPIYTKKGSSQNLQQGDELVVQIKREGIKTKGPALTTRLNFQGKYLLLDQAKTGIGVSRKLEGAKRAELKQRITVVWQQCEEHRKEGIVLRTNAAEVDEAVILAELKELLERQRKMREEAIYRTCYSCLYKVPSLWLRRMTALHLSAVKAIIIEDCALFEQAQQYLKDAMPEWLPVLAHYRDDLLPMEKLYSLEKELRDALAERVWLKSGAYLVIQPTEALTVIDVNTGKCETGRHKEEAVLKVNLEAAKETARQMRLRNLSGIIVVDFINMETDAAKRCVMEKMREYLLQDPIQANVVDMTGLNLVELTRKKVERPLFEQV